MSKDVSIAIRMHFIYPYCIFISQNLRFLKTLIQLDAQRRLRFHRSYQALKSRHFIALGPRGLLFFTSVITVHETKVLLILWEDCKQCLNNLAILKCLEKNWRYINGCMS